MPFGIQRARFATSLRKWFGIKGPMSLQLVDDVFPMLDLAHGAERPELFLERGEHLVSASLDVTSIAGQTPKLYVANPAGSGRLLVLTDMVIGISVASQVVRFGQGTLDTNPLPGGSTNLAIDDERVPNIATPCLQNQESTAAAPIAGRPLLLVTTVSSSAVPLRQVLPPNYVFMVQATVAGVSRLIACVRGYEYQYAEEELTPG